MPGHNRRWKSEEMKLQKLKYRGHDGYVYGAWFLRISNRAIRITKDRKESGYERQVVIEDGEVKK